MAQLAIKGHQTRGKEVIEIIKMLGGKTRHGKFEGHELSCGYYIKVDGYIGFKHYSLFDDTTIFTLEEFLEKFPYKVGDKVQHKGATSCGTVYVIEHMGWVNNHIEYEISPLYDYNHTGLVTVCAWDLQSYKEETMEELIRTEDITLEKSVMCTFLEMVEDEQRLRIAMNEGFELKEENGKFFVYKKNIKYPKTYKECCKVLNIPVNGDIVYAGNWVYGGEYLDKHLDKLRNFQKLFICRDAYWKLAGDEMGLDKLWKPYNGQESCKKHVIQTVYGKVTCLDTWCQTRNILEFPTAEMRDAFYENFKELIELCKELL